MATVSKHLRKIHRENTEVRRAGYGKYVARLKIDHQSFTIEYEGTKGHAEWMRLMLAKALYRFKSGDQNENP